MRDARFFSTRFFSVAGCVLLVGAGIVAAQEIGPDGRLVYPQGAQIPRSLTPVEADYVRQYGWGDHNRSVTPPPSGPVHCVAEYEPMEAILIAWEGGGSLNAIQAQMAAKITNEGATNLVVACDSNAVRNSASTTLTAAGVNMSRVKYVIRTIDTIWIRDYGPRYIYEGNCRAIVDHTYNRPRPNDDAFSSYFATFKHHAFYQLPLVHGGGNFHLDAVNRSYCTKLIDNENLSLTQQQIHDYWLAYQNVDTTFFDPFPTSVDSTQHLDMWVQIMADDKVMISDWPNNVGSTQDNICDAAAVTMAARGYTVYRLPARSVGGVHYTYCNVVVCNNIVLVPSYTNAAVQPHNAEAMTAWTTALPNKQIFAINCENIVSLAGVMHCIVIHVPAPKGGVNPTAYLKNLRGGDVLDPGSQVDVQWISDDDVSVASVDILLSTDGGVTFPTTIAAATADDGVFTWTIPPIWAPHARIRIVAHDGDGHTGFDQSTTDLHINGVPDEKGDLTCDGSVNQFDISPFVQALSDPAAYAISYPQCNITNGDMNADGSVNAFDIQGFVERLASP